MNKLLSQKCFQYSLKLMCSTPPGNTIRPTNFHKKMLVWAKKYNKIEDVPEYVSYGLIDRTKSQLRIKLANYMMGLTIIGCVIAIVLGKQSAEKGDTLHQQNLDWHKEYNQNFERATKK